MNVHTNAWYMNEPWKYTQWKETVTNDQVFTIWFNLHETENIGKPPETENGTEGLGEKIRSDG